MQEGVKENIMVKHKLKTKFCPNCNSNLERIDASTFGSSYYRCSKGCGYEELIDIKGLLQTK